MKKVKVKYTPSYQSYHSCGDEAEPMCGKCERHVEDGDNYCSHCGAKLDWEPEYEKKSHQQKEIDDLFKRDVKFG